MIPGEVKSLGQPVLWRTGDVIDGKYEVTGELGRGGMGQVYLVRHLGWGIPLAVKSPLPQLLDTPGAVERFVAEAQAWVSLGLHPNVCGCYYVRVLGGIPRVFAEYAAGGSLRARIDDRTLYQGDRGQVTARIVRIASQMARGLEHAHGRGVVHRDVKPANVLLGGDGDAAMITDFGLAGAAGGGAGGMTPAYASPEQAAGAPTGPRSDVYSFAVSVLEMFCGGVSWMVGSAAGEALAAFLSDGGTTGLPVPPPLARLLERCLSNEPGARPDSMTDVARELGALGAAAAPTLPGAVRLRAAEHNNRALSQLDLGAPDAAEDEFRAALAADPQHLEAAYNWGLLRWRNGEMTDEDLLTVVQGAGDLWLGRCLLAQVHLERGDLLSAGDILEPLGRDHAGEPEVQAALRVLEAGEIRRERTTNVQWQPDARPDRSLPVRFTGNGTRLMTGDADGGIRLWDTRTGTCLRVGGHPTKSGNRSTGYADISSDGRTAVVDSHGEDVIHVWDLTVGKLRREIRYWPDQVSGDVLVLTDLRLSPDGRRVFAAWNHGALAAWDLRTGSLIWTVTGLGSDSKITVSHDGSQLLVSTNYYEPYRFKLVHIDPGRGLDRVLADQDSYIAAMAFTPDSNTAVAGSWDQQIRVWDLHGGECRQRVASTAGGIRTLALSEDGRLLLTGGDDHSVRLWDMTAGRCLRTLHGHAAGVRRVWISPDGQTGLSVGDDNTVLTWPLRPSVAYQAPLQLSRPQRVTELKRLDDEVRNLVSQADMAIAVSGYATAHRLLTRARAIPGHERDSEALRAWRDLGLHLPHVGLRTAWTARVLSGVNTTPGPGRYALSVAADARVAASAHGGRAYLWDLTDGTMLRKFPIKEMVDGVDLSADGQRVVCGADFGRVRVWSVPTGEELHAVELGATRIPGMDDGISVCFTGDDRRVLLGNGNGTILVWDLQSGSLTRTPSWHDGVVKVLWPSTDGRACVSAARDGIRLWDVTTGNCVREIPVEKDYLRSVCLSPRGDLIIATWHGTPSTVLWNTAGEMLHEFGDQHCVARFSPDGRFVIAGDADGVITVWNAGNGECVQTISGHQNEVWDLQLTPDGRYLLSGSYDGTMRLWELDWDLDPRGTPASS